MKIETFEPQNKKLQNYIQSFYILTHSENEEKVSYLTFPSLFSVVATAIKAENIITPEHITTKYSTSKPLETSLVCRFNKPICFQYSGNIKEICIYFKPLGLNAFLENPLEEYSSSNFDRFVPFSDYEKSMKSILEIEHKTLLAENLEEYWSRKIIGFEHPFLNDAIHRIQEKPNIKTSDLANKYNVSQKTFIKHFKKHICKTPSEYKKILRFRKALTEMQQSDQQTKLTELSYLTAFFDQSHMVSNFKTLTGLSPKAFFKNLSTVENSNIHWIFN
ncbi:MAG: AraC family transcriptional regulator [Flavobacteriales bacterium]|nr:AraC family transcriptional regulator [Flavobacteriales bacterium]